MRIFLGFNHYYHPQFHSNHIFFQHFVKYFFESHNSTNKLTQIMEEIWNKISSELNLDPTASQIWLEKLKEKYNDSNRHYHTESQMLKSKLPHLCDQKPAVTLAALFQYYEYDSRSNSTERNCLAFNQFCKDTALKDVSHHKIFTIFSNFNEK